MNQINPIKFLAILFLSNLFESYIAPVLIGILVSLPITFLVFSFIIYRSKNNTNAIYAFGIGLYIDLISNTFFGLNGILFCLITYVINSYSNTFKLFSYLQICIFFGASSVFFIGLSNLFLAIENFSYLILFVSFFFNTGLALLIAMSPIQSFSVNRRLSEYD